MKGLFINGEKLPINCVQCKFQFNAGYSCGMDAQPERKKGKWIPYNGDKEDWLRSDGTPVFMQCSECHAMVINNFAFRWNFCAECGCRMECEEK